MLLHFLHPKFLWFLFLVLIPICIHLFHFKRFKSIYFSNLLFLKNLHLEHRRQSKLKNLLKLLCRILSLACVVLAFSQPYISHSEKKNSELIHIYIDNSFSMNGETEKGKALELAKNNALSLIKSLPNSNFRVYTNNSTQDYKNLKPEQAIVKIQQIEPSASSFNISELLQKIHEDFSSTSAPVYFFSDFQKSHIDFAQLKPDSSLNLNFVKLKLQNTNNLSIDSCWLENQFTKHGELVELSVKVRNYANKSFSKIPIKLFICDSLRSVILVDFPPKSSKIVQFRYADKTEKWVDAKLELEDFSMQFDNEMFFSYQTNQEFKFLCINQNKSNLYLNKLFSTSGDFSLTNCKKNEVHKHDLKKIAVIILNAIESIPIAMNQKLSRYLESGGIVLFIPGEKIEASVNSFLAQIKAPAYLYVDSVSTQTLQPEPQSEMYQNVFQDLRASTRFPKIYKHYKFSDSRNISLEKIWQTSGGENLFAKITFGKGEFYQLAIHLNPKWSNVVTHPIFIPSILNLHKRNAETLYQKTGKNKFVELSENRNFQENESFHIKNSKLGVDLIPLQETNFGLNTRLYTLGQIEAAGNYQITLKDSLVAYSSFNACRSESKLSFYTLLEMNQKLKEVLKNESNYAVISEQDFYKNDFLHHKKTPKNLWKLLILLGVLFLISEAVVRKS